MICSRSLDSNMKNNIGNLPYKKEAWNPSANRNSHSKQQETCVETLRYRPKTGSCAEISLLRNYRQQSYATLLSRTYIPRVVGCPPHIQDYESGLHVPVTLVPFLQQVILITFLQKVRWRCKLDVGWSQALALTVMRETRLVSIPSHRLIEDVW